MNQSSWIFVGNSGQRFRVGIAHGPESGHMLVHCNGKIILIDFNILESKTYPLFLDEELCELKIEKAADGSFGYSFEINREVDTPGNRARKLLWKKDMRKSVALLVGVIGFVLLSVWGLTSWNHMKDQAQTAIELEKLGRHTEVQIIGKDAENRNLVYFFTVNGKSYQAQSHFPGRGPMTNPYGMPLEIGDAYQVRYLPYNPTIHDVDFNTPTKKQIELYIDRSMNLHQELHPDKDPVYLRCFIEVAYDIIGLEALANIYYQKVPVSKNPNHNKDSFSRMVREQNLQEEVSRRCLGI